MVKIKELEYGVAVTSPDAELEIVILMSPGQSGSTSLYMICTGVDGGIAGMDDIVINSPYGKISSESVQVLAHIKNGLRKIRTHFRQPVDILTDGDIQEISDRIEEMFWPEEPVY